MKTAEAFIKSKFPEAYAAYQQYKKDEKAKVKVSEKRRKEKEMKNRKDFEDYPLYYYYEASYHGWTEGEFPKCSSIDLGKAFEKVENAVIDPSGFSGGMSFKKYLAHETEDHFFKRWFDILNGKSDELAKEISDSDYHVTRNPVHDGIKLFSRDEVKAFFRNAKYKDK
mgnify:FL=1